MLRTSMMSSAPHPHPLPKGEGVRGLLGLSLFLAAQLGCPACEPPPPVEDAGEDAGPPPTPLTLWQIAPDFGPSSGGTEVTVIGAGFEEGVTAAIGDKDLTELQVIDAQTLKGKTIPTPPGTYPVKVTRGVESAAALPDGGLIEFRFTCRIDDDCEALNRGLRCDEKTGSCVDARGCNDDTNCVSQDPDDYCYAFGTQCRCVTETNDTGFPGVCRRRRAPCEPCTDDSQCGQGAVFDPPGKCATIQGDTSGQKYCVYAAQPTCGCGFVNRNGYCEPQKSCKEVGCTADKDCPGGSVCDVARCLCEAKCRWDFASKAEAPPGCPPGRVCWVDNANLDPSSLFFGAGRCRPPCSSDTDCTNTALNPFGGPRLKCASEKLAGGGDSPMRCRANGECMDNLECPESPPTVNELGYCDRASFTCKTDCRLGIDPTTAQSYADCKPSYKCAPADGGNACVLQTCAEQGGARIACRRGQYCCGEDKNGDGNADPCPPATQLGPDKCYDAPEPPFCFTCQNDDDCKNFNPPAYLTGPGACTNGSKSPSCSPLPSLCIYGGNRPDNSQGVNVCAPSTYNDSTKDSFGVGKDQRGCPAGYAATGFRPKFVQGDDFCNSNADCSVGNDAGICDFDTSVRLQDGGYPKACLCTSPGQVGQCPNDPDAGITSVCKFGIATPTVCLQSVVCTPSFSIYAPRGPTEFGCGL
ncbi:MAG: IPT/TIG domain-containing protein [Myxococcota bacterium]